MSGTAAYFARRLMLVPATFLAITFLVYALLRIAPGGPIEQAEAAMKLQAMAGEASTGGIGSRSDLILDEQALEDLERYYALDRPIPVGYLQWLGAWPRPVRVRVPASTLEAHRDLFAPVRDLHERHLAVQADLQALLAGPGLVAHGGEVYRPLAEAEQAALPPDVKARVEALAARGLGGQDALQEYLAPLGLLWEGERLHRRQEETAENRETLARARGLMEALRLAGSLEEGLAARTGFEIARDGSLYRVEPRLSGILQLDFGRSYTHSEPVLGLILSRVGISLALGLTGYLLSWLVCVPLGVMKAVRHGSFFDGLTSVLVVLGYSVPGYVVAMLLLATLSARGWLPLGGYDAPSFAEVPLAEALGARLRSMVIPVLAYLAGSFALMTMLMKNSVMENLTADYVRTAWAKGLHRRRVLFVHVLRNSLIPLLAGIGTAVGGLFAGSFLIERTTNIPGLGLLGFEALMQRDYPIVMGTLVFGVLVTLLGNIVADLLWAAVDPRIRFGGRGR